MIYLLLLFFCGFAKTLSLSRTVRPGLFKIIIYPHLSNSLCTQCDLHYFSLIYFQYPIRRCVHFHQFHQPPSKIKLWTYYRISTPKITNNNLWHACVKIRRNAVSRRRTLYESIDRPKRTARRRRHFRSRAPLFVFLEDRRRRRRRRPFRAHVLCVNNRRRRTAFALDFRHHSTFRRTAALYAARACSSQQ